MPRGKGKTSKRSKGGYSQASIMEKFEPILQRLEKEINSTDPVVSDKAKELKDVLMEDLQQKFTEMEQLHEKAVEAITEKMEKQRMGIPAAIGSLTLKQIRDAGGSIGVDDEGNLKISVPGHLYQKEQHQGTSQSKLYDSAKKMKETVANMSAKKAYLSTNKRPRAVSTTSSTPSISTKKKIPRLKPSPAVQLDNLRMSTRRTVRKTMRPKALAVTATITRAKKTVKNDHSVFHSTMLEPGMSTVPSTSVMPPPSSTYILRNTPARKGSEDDLEVGLENLSLINPKTPGGTNRLFKKSPRKMLPDETVVFCSKAGTPLLIEKGKPVVNTTKGLSDEPSLALVQSDY